MKKRILLICKHLGVFALARWITRRRPRILCYHGVSTDDECRFRPGLFMRAETFANRMDLVEKWGFRVWLLDDLYSRSEADGKFPSDALVITIDDGWAAIEEGMLPELERRQYPSTLYLSTYFVKAQRPVFKVAVQYLFWKYARPYPVAQSSLLHSITGDCTLETFPLLDAAKELGAEREEELLRELCTYFGESYEAWSASGKFMFLDQAAAQRLSERGVDMQLHTHRHRFAECDVAGAEREIIDNRRHMNDLSTQPLEHFCYPRGEFTDMHLDVLRAQGIKTATTTRNELLSSRDDPLCWPRIVDSEHIDDLEFEAELSGFLSIARSTVGRFSSSS